MGHHPSPAYVLCAPTTLPAYCTAYDHVADVANIGGGAVVLVTSHMSSQEHSGGAEMHKSVSLKVYHSPFSNGEKPQLDLGIGKIKNWCVIAKEYGSRIEQPSHRRFGLESRIIDHDGAPIGEGVFFRQAYCAEAGPRGRFGGSNRIYRDGQQLAWEEIPSSCVHIPAGVAVADAISHVIAPMLEQHIAVPAPERNDFISHLKAGVGELLPAYLNDVINKPEQYMRRCSGICHARNKPLVSVNSAR